MTALPVVTTNGTLLSAEFSDPDLDHWCGDWRVQWRRVPSGLAGVSTQSALNATPVEVFFI